MTRKVLITPRSFAQSNKEPLEKLERLGFSVTLNPFGRILTKEEMIELIQDVEGVIVGVDPLDRDVLQKAKRLKVIAKYGVGTDNIDIKTADELGIAVTVTPNANTNAVAEYTVALLLATARRLVYIDRRCRKSDWSKVIGMELASKTLGIVGLGNIGKQVVRLIRGFQMKVLAYDVYRDEAFAAEHRIRYVPLETLLRESDFICLHSPLTDQTKHMIGHREFSVMKESAVIINTSRGGLIDENALLEALKHGRIWGAGIDVFEREPPEDKSFFELDNLIIGSHCAASTFEAINNMSVMAVDHLLEHIQP